MSWIKNVVPPRFKGIFTKREVAENLWIKCPQTGQLVFRKDLEKNNWVVSGSGYHMNMPTNQRFTLIFDETWENIKLPEVPIDPLQFRDQKRYIERLKVDRIKTGQSDAISVALGKLDGLSVIVAIQQFDFMAGSLGTAAGEALITGLTEATEKCLPFIIFTSSGGARMQEGILSLMQMTRTTIAVGKFKKVRKPYIVVLTNPTMGGVTASYAMLGDIHIAEPGAQIGFAGRRVIQQTVSTKLPEDLQTAEFLHSRGMIDMLVHRDEMKSTLARLCRLLGNLERRAAS